MNRDVDKSFSNTSTYSQSMSFYSKGLPNPSATNSQAPEPLPMYNPAINGQFAGGYGYGVRDKYYLDVKSHTPVPQPEGVPIGYYFNDANIVMNQSLKQEDIVGFNRTNSSSLNNSLYHLLDDNSGSNSPVINPASPNITRTSKNSKQSNTKRSRMGCLTCRGRKKRCCEQRPTCAECDRLGLKCNWPIPGLEYRNRSKNNKYLNDRNIVDTPYGKIKVLRGVVSKRD